MEKALQHRASAQCVGLSSARAAELGGGGVTSAPVESPFACRRVPKAAEQRRPGSVDELAALGLDPAARRPKDPQMQAKGDIRSSSYLDSVLRVILSIELVQIIGQVKVVRGLDANQPIFDVRTMEEFYDMRVVSTGNTIMEIVAGMGVMGLILAMGGLYGLGAYAVSRRTREIGIRMAIGASRPAVLRMALRQGLTPALYGLAAGLVTSVFADRLLKSVFPALTKTDIAAYFLVVPALLVITMMAAYIPARHASRIDPMTALRYE